MPPPPLRQLARESFPLCMRHMHFKLRETHHIRYEGRAQLGLFLKGIGLSLEDAMAFWRNEFTKVKTVEQFEKGYAYNIRHLYGKEGKRTDYTPRSCVNIITGTPPGANEHHGAAPQPQPSLARPLGEPQPHTLEQAPTLTHARVPASLALRRLSLPAL